MPYDLLLLPLLGGYVFVRNWNRTRYYASRSEGYRLLFQAAIAGSGFLFLAIVLTSLFDRPLSEVNIWWHLLVPIQNSGKSALAFVLGAVSWVPLNRYWHKQRESARVIAEKGDPLEFLVQRAVDEFRPVIMRMKNKEVYIGLITASINPAVDVKSLRILVVKHGFEDEALSIKYTEDHDEFYRKISEEHLAADQANHLLEDQSVYEVAVPYSEVQSARFFY